MSFVSETFRRSPFRITLQLLVIEGTVDFAKRERRQSDFAVVKTNAFYRIQLGNIESAPN